MTLRVAGLVAPLWLGLSLCGLSPARAAGYRWDNVVIGGGGPVTGITPHPKVRGLIYLRTSSAGFFRLDDGGHRWQPLSDRFPFFEQNLYGGEALAIDPSDAARLYLAAGKELDSDWGKGVLLRSLDRGRTLQRDSQRLAMAGAGELPWLGERLAVSPFHPEVVLFGSRRDGLWRSHDHGDTWEPVRLDAKPRAGVGVAAVVFDITQEGLVYINAFEDGIQVSQDDGLTFRRLPGSPTEVMGMSLARSGVLYLTSRSPQGVFKYLQPSSADAAPLDITPPGGHPGFGPLAVEPVDGQHLIVAYDPQSGGGSVLWRSIDGGQRWQMKDRFLPLRGAPHWPPASFAAAVTALTFDPLVRGRLYLADRLGVWRGDEMGADTPAFTSLAAGHEQHDVLALAAPPGAGPFGPRLLSGVQGYDGFLHDQGLGAPPREALGGVPGPRWQATRDIAYCEARPLQLLRVGGTDETTPPTGGAAASADGGKTWKLLQGFTGLPLRAALSARSPAVMVILTSDGLQRSADGGASWSASWLTDSTSPPAPSRDFKPGKPGKLDRKDRSQDGAPVRVAPTWELAPEPIPGTPVSAASPGTLLHDVMSGPLPDGAQPLAADRVDGARFYYYHDGRLYRSVDGGRFFGLLSLGLPQSRWQVLRTEPGAAQALWLALDRGGLLRSRDGGQSFTRVPGVSWAHLIAFGKPAPGSAVPALYLYGTLEADADGQPQVFRSLDEGRSWQRISVPDTALGAAPQVLEASREQFGLVFVGTAGRGLFYGQPL